MVERNMCNAVMRGIVVPPGSRATSRAKGSRRIPEVGAVCGKAAPTDLSGGCEVTRVPTATEWAPEFEPTYPRSRRTKLGMQQLCS